MTTDPADPRAAPPPAAPFDWHPEPELVGYRDPAASAGPMLEAGFATWEAAIAYLYDEGFARGMGVPTGYADLRGRFFDGRDEPGSAPADPSPWSDLLEEWRTRLAPHLMNAYHPRAWGYFTPPPLVASVLGELLSQVAHQGVDVWHAGPVGAFVEEEVVGWLCDLVGYGPGSFGLLTSGGVMANFIALALARDVHLRRLRGLDRPPRGAALEGIRVYASDQAHFSVGRALDELGFPADTLVVVPSDDRFRLRGAPVQAAIERDRAAGHTPLAIAAVAGSTNTGSVDRVGELADVAAHEDLWLHVDAAYGAAARLSEREEWRMPDLARADSVTVDPHKWMFQAYDIGGLVVRDGGHLLETFGGRRPEYYRGGEAAAGGATGAMAAPGATGAPEAALGDVADDHDDPGQLNFYKLGFEGTRRWRALKLWLSWKHLGTSGLARLVEANIAVAAHLGRAIAASDDFGAMPAEPELSVVCFRHLPGGRAAAQAMAPEALDAHQDRLQAALEASGDGWLSTTRLRGATYLRAGVLNYLSTEDDADALLATLRRLAAETTHG